MTRRAVLLLNQVVDKQMAETSPTQIKEWRDYFWKISLLLFPGGFSHQNSLSESEDRRPL